MQAAPLRSSPSDLPCTTRQRPSEQLHLEDDLCYLQIRRAPVRGAPPKSRAPDQPPSYPARTLSRYRTPPATARKPASPAPKAPAKGISGAHSTQERTPGPTGTPGRPETPDVGGAQKTQERTPGPTDTPGLRRSGVRQKCRGLVVCAGRALARLRPAPPAEELAGRDTFQPRAWCRPRRHPGPDQPRCRQAGGAVRPLWCGQRNQTNAGDLPAPEDDHGYLQI